MGTGKFKVFLGTLALAAAAATTAQADVLPRVCVGNDCMPKVVEACADMVLPPQGHPAGWDVDMSPDVDRRNYGGTVIAYQIQWFNGTWSGWYFKNQNDVDWKVNEDTGSSRRVWSYFTDHTHRVMLCR